MPTSFFNFFRKIYFLMWLLELFFNFLSIYYYKVDYEVSCTDERVSLYGKVSFVDAINDFF